MSSANNDLPRYDIEISDGANKVGLRVTAGKASAIRRIPRGQGVEDKEHTQSDWSGGRGASVVADDPDKFFDSYAALTDRSGQITPAPLPGFGIVENSLAWRNVNVWPSREAANAPYLYTVIQPGDVLGWRFTIAATYSNPHVFWWSSMPEASDLAIQMYTDAAGVPGTGVYSANALGEVSHNIRLHYVRNPLYPLIAGTYWLVLENNGDLPVTVVTTATTSADSGTRVDGVWASNTGRIPYYHVGDFGITNQLGGKFFEYKRQLYYAASLESGSQVYMNGERGLANYTGAATTTVVSPTSWVNDIFNGCVYVVTNGPYAGESVFIGDTTAAGVVTLLNAGRHTYASPHEYAILGHDRWIQRVNAAGSAITDVAVVGEWVYLARGDSADIIRYREYNNAGTWTVEAVTETGVRAHLLKVVTRAGKKVIYRIWGGANSLTRQYFSKADVPAAWGTALVFGADAPVSVDGSPCQAILDFDGEIWLTTESDVYEIHDTGGGEFATKRPGPSEASMRDPYNGLGAVWWNTNFYFAYQEGYMRVYGRTVDDIGPNRGEGLPSDRRGNIVSAAPMFGTMAVALSSNVNNRMYGTIMLTTAPGGSWHEIFRAPLYDIPIGSLFYQSIPTVANRLWFVLGDHLMYLVMPNTAQNVLNDYNYMQVFSTAYQAGMLYSPVAEVTMPWTDFGAPDRDHYWRELRVYTENMGAGAVKTGIGTNLGTATIRPTLTIWPNTEASLADIDTSPYQFIPVNQRGNRAQLRLEIRGSNASIPPVLRSYSLMARQFNEVRYDININFAHMDRLQLVNGGQANDESEQTMAVLAQLADWQENGSLLTLTSRHPAFDGIHGHIDPVPITAMSFDPNEKRVTGAIVFREV